MKRLQSFTLQTCIIIFALTIVSLLVIGMGIFFYFTISKTIEEKIADQALDTAESIADIPEIREAFTKEKPSATIQPLVEKIRKDIEAEFIVVGNRQGIRYSHPIPERIGKEMVGGDNTEALLYGRASISRATGSLGPSLRGKAPIFDEHGHVIGVVSVGFMIQDIDEIVGEYRNRVLGIAVVALLLGAIGAIYLARHIKNKIFGLEPEEIASLFTERNAVIESVREGMVVVDRRGKVTLANQAAYEILSLPPETPLTGRFISDLFPYTGLIDLIENGEKQYDRHVKINEEEVIVNRVPIFRNGKVTGAVASFRRRSEIDQLTQELSQVKRYADALREQTHEFSNTLYTISGATEIV